jgi:hypothetical protein
MRRLVSLILILATAALGLYAKTYVHPKLQNKQKTIRSVVLLPPTAQMTAEGIKSDFKEKESEPLASAVGIVVSNALKKRGWEVNDAAFTSLALQDNEELKYLVGYLRARHQTLVGQIVPKDVSKGRYSLGDGVAALSKRAPADVLVLVHAEGRRFTMAGRVFGVAVLTWIGGLPVLPGAMVETLEKYVSLRISLVDSRTGEILCYSTVSGAGEKKILEELRKVP